MTENKEVIAPAKAVEVKKKKAIVYIDGFNLYFAINERGWRNLLWLDLVKLAESLIDPATQELVGVKYFTSPIKKPADKRIRQRKYLDALATLKPMLEIFEGHYIENWVECHAVKGGCGRRWRDDKEKQTDVNIAVRMLIDTFAVGRVDDLILVTADSDQVPAINVVRAFKKHVLIVIPPGRTDYLGITQAAGNNKLELTKTRIAACLLPKTVKTKTGFEINCPPEYL